MIAGGVFLLALLSFPIWSVWIAKPAASFAGVEIGEIESSSWNRWHAKDIKVDRDSLSFSSTSVELPSPSSLILEYFSSSPGEQSITVEDWELALETGGEITPTEEPAPSIGELIALAQDGLSQFENVLKSVEIGNGSVQIEGEDAVSVKNVHISNKKIETEISYLPNPHDLKLILEFGDAWNLNFQVPQLDLASALEISPKQNALELSGSLTSSQNPIQIQASWDEQQTDFIPQTLDLATDSFLFDQRYGFWGQAPAFAFDSQIKWADQRLSYLITGREAEAEKSAQQIRFEGHGNLNEIVVKTASIDLPWLELQNQNEIRIDPSLATPPSDAQLSVQLILDAIPYFEAKGRIQASLETSSDQNQQPIVSGQLKGTSIKVIDTVIKDVSGKIGLRENRLTLEDLKLLTEQGSKISGNAGFDLDSQQFEKSTFNLSLANESQTISQIVPELSWTELNGEFSAEGPLANPSINGSFNAQELSLPGTVAINTTGTLNGSLSNLEANFEADNGADKLTLALTLVDDEQLTAVSINELLLADSTSNPLLALNNTSTLSIHKADSSISLPQLDIQGSKGAKVSIQNLELTPDTLSLNATLAQLSPAVLASWLTNPLPDFVLNELKSDVLLNEANSQIKLNGLASWNLDQENTINFNWNANNAGGSTDELKIEELSVSSNAQDILSASGTLPVSLSWAQNELTSELSTTHPIEFVLQTVSHPSFWNTIGDKFDIGIQQPNIDAQLSGTLENPKGTIEIGVETIDWRHPEDETLSLNLEKIKASVLANSTNLEIATAEAYIGENSVRASATLPLPASRLVAIASDPSQFDSSKVDADIQLSLTDLQALAALLPGMLRHEGEILASVKVDSGEIEAEGKMTGISTRPLPPLGAMSEITGDFVFKDGTLNIRSIKGLADKSPFTLEGTANVENLEDPRFDLHFFSKDFPMARDDGIMLSGDIDMKVVSDDKGQTAIRGDLLMKKGLFLVEPDLLASSTKTVSSRPPYFAVDAEPFKDWELDIGIKGDQFLQVSNSFFEGTLSAEFSLEGNLGAPLLIGAAETNKGTIFFPSSALKIRQGRGFITRDRPNDLQVEARAAGRLFAYDINLEVGGAVPDVDLVITSNPALTQVEALLLMTTGTLPNAQGTLAANSASTLGSFIGKGIFKKLTGGNSASSSKLSLDVGRDISLQGKKTVEASYQLNEKLELQGEYDKRDEFNGNLKWRIFKR